MRDAELASLSRHKNVVVIGGGVSGMTAAVEAAESGSEVLLVDAGHLLGGRLNGMHKYFPKLDSPTVGLEIHLRRIRRNPRITELTNTDAVAITGTRGNFIVELSVKPNFIGPKCDGCAKCVDVCPVETVDKFNYSMGTMKAIHHLPNEMSKFVIDPETCKGVECGKCADICPQKAVDLKQNNEKITVQAESIVVATGWEPYDATKVIRLGFGKVPNVINNMMMERLVAPNGPTKGQILRPSDSTHPAHIVFVQCAGSRDDEHLPYCSSVCCMASLKQAVYIRDAYPDTKITVIYTELTNPCPGRYDKFLAKVIDDEKIKYQKARVLSVAENSANGGVVLEIEDSTGTKKGLEADMVVLATGMVPSILSNVLKEVMVLDKHGFMDPQFQKEGVYITGTAKMPFDVTSSMLDAAGTALRILQRIRQ